MKGKAIVLGSGTSQGVPLIACNCQVCSSNDLKDKRLRSSLLFHVDQKNYVIDAGPDFRQQMLRANVNDLEGILFTHEHKDHIAGLDDVRAYNYRYNSHMDVFCTLEVENALKREFSYIFNNDDYPGIPKIKLHQIDKAPFQLSHTCTIIPIQVNHYKMPVLGFRIGDFAYITDAKTIAKEESDKLKGINILIINALHQSKHISHFNLEEALAFIELIQPKKAYLTHISHLFGKHNDIQALLPPNVYPAYDGLEIDFNY